MTTREKVLVGVTVAAIGVAAYATYDLLAGDEDRPPIIVRGGSLHFENTTTKRPGKKWKEVTTGNKKEWELDDGNGKKVSFFQIYFVPSTASACLPLEGDEVVVNFDSNGDGSADRKYTVKIVDERPVVIGTHDLELDTDTTRLVASLEGKITTVTVGSTVCAAPILVYLEPIKKRNNP